MANQQAGLLQFNEISSIPTPSSGLQSIYAKPDGFIYSKNSTGTEYLLNNPISYTNTLTSVFPAVAQTNVTRVPITGWSFNVVAGKNYKIQVIAGYTTAAIGTGGSMGVTLTTAVGSINGIMNATIVSTSSATNLTQSIYAVNTTNGTAGSFLTSSGMTAGGVGSFNFDAVFVCTTSGTFNILWGTEVTLSLAQLRAGSSLIVTQLN
jgi:hypothetical protein